jgi:hypothetical protein
VFNELIFDETLLQGTEQEVLDRWFILKSHGCILVRRSITAVLREYVDQIDPADIRKTKPPPPKKKLRGRKVHEPACLNMVVAVAKFRDSPRVFTNATFIPRCFKYMGIHLDYTPSRFMKGVRPMNWGDIHAGDVIAFSLPDNEKKLYGIATNEKTIVYASVKHGLVIERTLEELNQCAFHGMKRMLPEGMHRRTDIIRLPAGRKLAPTKETVRMLLAAGLKQNAA